MERLRVGVIGCGSMGKNLAKACKAIDGVEVSAVSDINSEAVKSLSEETGASPFENYGDMLRNANLDAVIIASPPFLHPEMTIAAAEQRLHIFCEKPMAPTKADCLKMIDACEKNNVKLMIGQVCRFHPVHSKVREIVQSGELGQAFTIFVRRIGGGFGGVWDVPWRKKLSTSGGALMEVNAHEIDFMRWVCGDVDSVFAVGVPHPLPDVDYPGSVFLSMKFASGASGLLHSSQISSIPIYGGRIDCEKGSISFEKFWGEGAGIQIATRDGKSEFISAKDIKVEHPVTHELRVFFEAVINDTEPPVTGHDGMAAVEIAEAAYRSIELGTPIALPL